ncbi:hypothetical protein [Pseudomonas sp. BN414]|uniref:hypothetical protein n=1 Tax=Pseudomonas sp. BN414 TaxID=2567888 RepID=UPI002453CFD2|nr:hypothetical protein [Pseudomonas sp. BN414]
MKALEDVTLGEFILAEENAVRKKGGPWGRRIQKYIDDTTVRSLIAQRTPVWRRAAGV